MDKQVEFDAARKAAAALWDGLTEDELDRYLEEADLEGGCFTRWELLAFVDQALGSNLRLGYVQPQ